MFARRQGTALILLAALSLPEVSSRAEANGQGGLYRGPGRSPTRGELLALLAGGSLGPPGTPPDFECAWRTLAADFAAALQPWRPPAAQRPPSVVSRRDVASMVWYGTRAALFIRGRISTDRPPCVSRAVALILG